RSTNQQQENTMSDIGKYNIKADIVQITETNLSEVIGKKYTSDSSVNNALDEIIYILNELNNKYPNVSETTATEIINAEFTEIQNTQPKKWAIIKDLFDGKSWLNGGKTALIKVGEHYSENNVFYKAAVGFGEGFTQ
ncbi:MAG: hypothetical protein AB4063_17380, partial [Crocosphaera sp.]